MADNFLPSIFRRKSELYKTVFGSKEGKLVLADLYKFTMVTGSRYVPGDTHATAYNEGMARVGLRIRSFLNTQPEELEKLLKLNTMYDQSN